MSQNLLDIQLYNAGYTLTKPRKIITKKILDLTSNHMDGDLCCETEEVNHSHSFASEDLVNSAPDIGRATIFRILKNLSDIGSICKIDNDGSVLYTRSLSDGMHHHHLLCVRCGCVSDRHFPAFEKIMKNISSSEDWNLISHQLVIYMECLNCIKK
ncbi:MAG: hypothetical protein CL746_01765 [Chloroflexi bacterium]|nr:hypothetical protein [Chloroflexota bacterium]|tara:strand:+ start:459 stop:926 length:468 start_codon:yes stop_codon:yes gene_type:complete